MFWIARLVLFVPAVIAGWFVARDSSQFWVIAFAIALVLMAVTAVVSLYFPRLGFWRGRR